MMKLAIPQLLREMISVAAQTRARDGRWHEHMTSGPAAVLTDGSMGWGPFWRRWDAHTKQWQYRENDATGDAGGAIPPQAPE
jgi:hypothetical protein